MKKAKRKIIIISVSVAAALALLFGACAIYFGDYYRADEQAIAAFAHINEVSFRTLNDGSIVFEPENASVGFIFYPGGKVENDAYKPLMASLAKEGVLCVLVEMPFNLAVFDINAADGIKEQYPSVKDWYIGGHSLGGSMAASYLESHASDYKGLVLLGSYSTSDLSGTSLEVISVYGSEDKVLNREKYDKNKSNLPSGFTEVVIDGGCHAYFGTYGAQDGDGTPTISNAEQISLTVESIVKMMRS
ncbi:MAG: alpha/beta hydrolase [Ruminococcaceae bacterium]|nr:alpha/beta hydrolase [Oscillospiraceae bacterium]